MLIKTNPVIFVPLLFIGMMFSIKRSNAQHLLEYGSSKKVVKVIAEKGGALYYINWPDTVDGITKAMLMSDITSLKALTMQEADSAFAALNVEVKLEQKKKKEEEKIKRQNRDGMSMEFDLNTAITRNRMDIGAGFGLGTKVHDGLEILVRIGYDHANQGKGFIYTKQVPLSLQVYRNLITQKLMSGIPFIHIAGGYNFVLSGKVDTSVDREEKYLEYTNELLQSNVFCSLGGGINYNRIRLGLSYKLQGSNVKYPEIGYMHFVMVKLAMKLL